MKTTLVIMAAGIGSRFGGGIKQLAPVGLNGEIIMDYSIHDAIEAGFNKIVFIIRKDIKDAFKEAIGDRIEKICKDLDVEIAYAYQELNELPEGVELPAGRTKPWVFFAEAKCRLLQNVMYVGCCKQTLGATPPNPCKINGCGKSEPTFTPSVDSAITYKRGLQSSVFYSCNKHLGEQDKLFLLVKKSCMSHLQL